MPDILANTIVFAATTLSELLRIYVWIVIIAAVLSWVNPDPYNPIVRALYGMTEPVLDWVREHLPVYFGGLDFSPIVVIIAAEFVQQVLIRAVIQAATPGGLVYGS
jgi:YggT family protein